MGLQDDKHENVINFLHQSQFQRFMIDNDEQAGALSDTWLKLLGAAPTGSPEIGKTVETLSDDPWSVLTLGQEVELIDLQHIRLDDVHISLSEMEVEQALQIMQEQPAKNSDQT